MYMNIFLAFIFTQTWHFEPIPDVDLFHISLDVDSCGIASIAYWKDSIVYCSRRTIVADSAIWLAESVDATPLPSFTGSSAFAVGCDSRPHILYHKWRTFPVYLDLFYATKDSSGALSISMFDSFAVVGDVDTDSTDFPHVVYLSIHPGSGGLHHKYWDGSNWICEFVDSSGGIVSLKIDRNNSPHIGLGAPIAYDEYRQGYVGYGYRDSSGWHLEYMNQYDVRDLVGIDTDDECNPHLAFSVFYDSCFHLVKSDSQWIVENVTAYGYYSSRIGIENAIVHLLGSSGSSGMVRHAWKQDGTWLTEDIHDGDAKDLAIEKKGYLHCLLIDSGTVIYGTNRPQAAVSEEVKKASHGSPARIVYRFPVAISFDTEISAQVRILDICGRLVKKLSHPRNGKEILWSGADENNRRVTNGLYFVVTKGNNEVLTQKIIIIE